MALPSFPIPNVRDEVLRCAGMTCFGNADVARAFYQLRLLLTASLALSVATHRGNYRPICVPEGVLFGSQYLQQVMTKVLEADEDFTLVLFDNLFMFCSTLERFWEAFIWILERCIEYGVVLSLKVIFGMQVTFSGLREKGASHLANDPVRMLYELHHTGEI